MISEGSCDIKALENLNNPRVLNSSVSKENFDISGVNSVYVLFLCFRRLMHG